MSILLVETVVFVLIRANHHFQSVQNKSILYATSAIVFFLLKGGGYFLWNKYFFYSNEIKYIFFCYFYHFELKGFPFLNPSGDVWPCPPLPSLTRSTLSFQVMILLPYKVCRSITKRALVVVFGVCLLGDCNARTWETDREKNKQFSFMEIVFFMIFFGVVGVIYSRRRRCIIFFVNHGTLTIFS